MCHVVQSYSSTQNSQSAIIHCIVTLQRPKGNIFLFLNFASFVVNKCHNLLICWNWTIVTANNNSIQGEENTKSLESSNTDIGREPTPQTHEHMEQFATLTELKPLSTSYPAQATNFLQPYGEYSTCMYLIVLNTTCMNHTTTLYNMYIPYYNSIQHVYTMYHSALYITCMHYTATLNHLYVSSKYSIKHV